MGGLANQIREYIYGRYLEYRTGQTVFYDDSWFFIVKIHNGYELKRVFNLNLPLMSNFFKESVFNEIVEKKYMFIKNFTIWA